ncbi:conjugal transfer protein TraP [Enterobacter hormaechei]
MMLKFLAVLLYCLRWLAWAFHYLIVWPAATLMLLVAMLLWMENTTPGKVLAQEIVSVTRDVGSGEYRLLLCRDEHFAPFIPALAKDKSTAGSAPVAPSAICQKQVSVITDAEGYAAHIDGSLSVFKQLWAVMASVFAGLALLMKRRPYFSLNGQMRSAHFRYGISASRPASATETVKTGDNKKEDNRE